MPTECQWCRKEMHVLAPAAPSANTPVVSFCRTCDRRACKTCKHSEQNVYATSCSNCGVTFDE